MVILMKILQVVLALSILILIHELGHFAFAKLFKIRVSKFYLFFDIGGKALFKFKPKNSETEYGIGWLPLGGYCKIEGMIDESMDTESLKKEPEEWEFRSKPAWQRLLVMAGGILFNFILAIILFTSILSIWGEGYYKNENQAIYTNELAQELGFQNGDKILRLDDWVPEDFGMLQAELARRSPKTITVQRGKDTIDIYLDHKYIADIIKVPYMFQPALPFIVDTIPPTSANADCPLVHGDKIINVADKQVSWVQDSRKAIEGMRDTIVPVQYIRDGDTASCMLSVDSSSLLGIFTKGPEVEYHKYNVLSAIPAGFRMTFENIGGYVQDLKLVFTPSTEAYKSVGSFVALGEIFPGNWNIFIFIQRLAILSIMLGVMNLLPIPALDGGHIVFTLYEMITRKKPSIKVLTIAQIIGMVLLTMLMFLAFSNDIGRLLR